MNYTDTVIDKISDTPVLLGSLFNQVANVGARILVGLVIFLVLWFLGYIIEKAFRHVVGGLGINKVLDKTLIGELVRKSGYKLDIGKLIGVIIKWMLIIGGVVSALDVIGLQKINDFLGGEVLEFIPVLIVAVLILVAGSILANFLGNLVSGSTKASGILDAKMIGSVTRWTVFLFAFYIALQQIGIPFTIINFVLIGVIAGLSLAFGLAFGLGGRDMAGKALERMNSKIKRHD